MLTHFTSESVTEGHPDKMADKISDSILDAILTQDPTARVACETLLTTGLVLIAGEITTTAHVDYSQIARDTIKKIGYDSSDKGFCYKTCATLIAIGQQSLDIAQGVTQGQGLLNDSDQGAGDQGLMFGYAIRESEELMPLSIDLSHKLAFALTQARRSKLDWLRPDGKTQVTVEYKDQKPKRVDTVVISAQHAEHMSHQAIEEALIEEVIKKTIPAHYIDQKTKFLINPTGRFVIGGPHGDCGLTGRKIIVDSYGGHGGHGGGAFSGKDPSKVDRSASYMARYVAKNVVAAGLADRCLIQIAYVIGMANPISLLVQTFGTEKISSTRLYEAITTVFKFKPAQIIQKLNLTRPVYEKTAAYGHFGRREAGFTWEETDQVESLCQYL